MFRCLEPKTCCAALALALLLGCGGAFVDVRKERDIVLFQDDSGKKPVLVSSQGWFENKDKYRDVNEEELAPWEIEKAERWYLLGGRCHASGAVIPPLGKSEVRRLWLGRLEELSSSLANADPSARLSDDVYMAETLIPSRFPMVDTLAALDDSTRHEFREIVTKRLQREREPQGVFSEGLLYRSESDPVKYTVIIEKIEGRFVAISPEFPGITACGNNVHEASRNIEIIIETKVRGTQEGTD